MKYFKYFTVIFTMFLLSACDEFQETSVKGFLKIDVKSGWTKLDFKDAKTKAPFSLEEGPYTLAFITPWTPWSDPVIQIKTPEGKIKGHLAIPRKLIKEDGTFEMYVANLANTNSFNVLGGRRVVVLARNRFVTFRESCTYTESYFCTNSKGELSRCTRTKWGRQDVLSENRKVKSQYRILFDGADMVTPAVFSGESEDRDTQVRLSSTTCK